MLRLCVRSHIAGDVKPRPGSEFFPLLAHTLVMSHSYLRHVTQLLHRGAGIHICLQVHTKKKNLCEVETKGHY